MSIQTRKLKVNKGSLMPDIPVRKGPLGNTPRALGLKPKMKTVTLRNKM